MHGLGEGALPLGEVASVLFVEDADSPYPQGGGAGTVYLTSGEHTCAEATAADFSPTAEGGLAWSESGGVLRLKRTLYVETADTAGRGSAEDPGWPGTYWSGRFGVSGVAGGAVKRTFHGYVFADGTVWDEYSSEVYGATGDPYDRADVQLTAEGAIAGTVRTTTYEATFTAKDCGQREEE